MAYHPLPGADIVVIRTQLDDPPEVDHELQVTRVVLYQLWRQVNGVPPAVVRNLAQLHEGIA